MLIVTFDHVEVGTGFIVIVLLDIWILPYITSKTSPFEIVAGPELAKNTAYPTPPVALESHTTGWPELTVLMPLL